MEKWEKVFKDVHSCKINCFHDPNDKAILLRFYSIVFWPLSKVIAWFMVLIVIQYDLKNAGIDIDGNWKNEIYTKFLHNTNDNIRKEVKEKKITESLLYEQ